MTTNQDPAAAGDRDLPGLLRSGLAAHPDRVAVRDRYGTVLTYRDLWASAQAGAQRLTARGIGPEDRVGVLAERTAGTIVAVLAVLLAGAAYVPVDPASRERGDTALDRAGVRETLDGAAPVHVPPPGTAPAFAPRAAHPRQLLYVLHTSGSTGEPKGVMIEQGSVASFVTSIRDLFRITPDDRVLQFSSFAFDTSVFEVFTALAAGAELVVAGREERADVLSLTRMIRDHGVTVADIPPSVLELMDPEDVPGLRLVFSGGEPCSGALADRWSRRLDFWHGYGPTEATVAATACLPGPDGTAGAPRVPLGHGIGEADVRVLDGRLDPAPVGAAGELCVGGPVVGRGYRGAPSATALVFVPDPASREPGGRMYRTGDMVRREEDGTLLYLSRRDRQIKVNGVRIEPGEIENVLRRDPAVRQALVDVFRVDGRELLAAVVTGRDVSADGIRRALAAWFPTWMVPERILVLDAMPRTLTDKVDRQALTERLHETPADAGTGAGGFSALEQRVARELFAPALGREPSAPDDDYFGLGGNSLEAIRMLTTAPGIFGVELPVGDFIADSTVAGVAHSLAAALETVGAGHDR
ncbi:non-ribosomal peptide synthetase [Streptomyces sp. NPDC059783]|uniref:non-ribosomal peptide synthetase n=1 Tax=Streptomyces sp. NPDC059783 TaxID=3346944 RepID=UPI00366383CF